MNGETTYIESLGIYLPPNETSSESRVGGIRSRIRVPLERFTGIASTRRVNPGEYSFDLACRAVERALARSNFHAEDIGLVIACNISKYDHEGFLFSLEPNTATSLRQAFGFTNAIAFDVNNACAGMFTGILLADCFLHTTGSKAAVVVSGEYISHLADTAQREIISLSDPHLASLTLGDAGAAVVLARSHDTAVGFHSIEMHTLGGHSGLCRAVPSPEGPAMHTECAELLKVGSPEIVRQFLALLDEHGWTFDTIDHVIPHQISKSATESFFRQVNFGRNGHGLPRSKMVDNLATRGNTATTTHLVALHDHIENQRIRPGDRVAFVLAASGLTVGTALYVLDELPLRVCNGRAARQPAANGHARRPCVPKAPDGVSIVSVATTRLRHGTPSNTAEIALEAAEACLLQAHCRREDIGALIFTGVFKSGFIAEPSFASILSGKLLPHAAHANGNRPPLAFDIHHGPNGFLAACETLRTMMARRGLRAGLVIAAEFDDNRRLAGHPALGVAEVASAALVLAPGAGGARLGNCRFYSFDEHQASFQASLRCVHPPHIAWRASADYELRLRASVRAAITAYLPWTGRTLADFDEFYFPQVSAEFLDRLGEDLAIARERIADVTISDGDLYTSSLPCVLEHSIGRRPEARGRVGLAVTVSPGINVGCGIVEI